MKAEMSLQKDDRFYWRSPAIFVFTRRIKDEKTDHGG